MLRILKKKKMFSPVLNTVRHKMLPSMPHQQMGLVV